MILSLNTKAGEHSEHSEHMMQANTLTEPAEVPSGPLPAEELRKIDAYWRAANYLSVGQIYLFDNPLLTEPLRLEHIKPRLLGHWGTTPGLNFVYAHCNRIIKKYDLDMIYICGPGHGGPGMVANTYLEGTYSELYPNIAQDAEGMKRLFKQFSFPGGIPSHAAPETPGSINEGGELGYSLLHAYGAVFDNPGLIACCVIGDGEAETGALATSWHSNKFLNPARDGAVLPILHLNGYKIAGPTVLARIPRNELTELLAGYGYHPYFVSGHEPEPHAPDHGGDARCHRGRDPGHSEERAGARLLRAPAVAHDRAGIAQGLDRAEGGGRRADRRNLPRAPGAAGRTGDQAGSPADARRMDEELSPAGACSIATARLIPELAELAPKGTRRMGANPHANGGLLLRDLRLPDFRSYAVKVPKPGTRNRGSHARAGRTCCATS